MRSEIQKIVVQAVAGTKDLTKAIDELLRLYSKPESDKYVMYLEESGKITIQEADYVEDGFYVEIIDEEIMLYEIPLGGGEERKVGAYKTVIEAINYSKTLT